MKLSKKAAKMFTLIEVMIVLAIIGIIAGIGVPQFQKYRDSAYAKKRLLSIEQFKTACQSYLIEFDIINPDATVAKWENSKGIVLAETLKNGGLNLTLAPFDITDIISDDDKYSVFDFIKGGAASLNVGKTDFIAPTDTKYIEVKTDSVTPANNWANIKINEVVAGFFFYKDGTKKYSNATGLSL